MFRRASDLRKREKGCIYAIGLICVISACASGGPVRLRAPASADTNEAFFCVVAAANQLGYRAERRDRNAGVIVARGIQQHGRTATGAPIYDEITVSILHEPAGDFLFVTATDKGHAERVIRQCRAR